MKRLQISVIICLTIFIFGGMHCTVRAESESFKEISAPEVKAFVDDANAIVVHVLSEIEYNIQHISGSINIPIVKMNTTDKLPEDKDTLLVFYCMGKR